MTERKKAGLWISLVCMLCALTTAVGYLMSHGDQTYRLWLRARSYDALRLESVSLEGETVLWTEEMLASDERVSFSNTMMLINSSHPLPEDFIPLLQEYNGARMHPDMVASYVALRDEVQRRTGIRIYVASDYRTREEQETILAESGGSIAAAIGCSEHEAGLALDVYAPYFAGESFLKSDAGRAVSELCAAYGFVIRYPLGKENVTGISYEPWHLRYVGAPHAALMSDAGLTLEEYLAFFEEGMFYRFGDFLISKQSMGAIFLPVDFQKCQILPDNAGNCLILLKK